MIRLAFQRLSCESGHDFNYSASMLNIESNSQQFLQFQNVLSMCLALDVVQSPSGYVDKLSNKDYIQIDAICSMMCWAVSQYLVTN